MHKVQIGRIILGRDNNVIVQTMTNTDTNDIDKTVSQCIELFDAGAKFVRITAQTEKEAEKLEIIKQILVKKAYKLPLIADIHFQPKAALIASKFVEKVRINPGNYTTKNDKKTIEDKLKPLLDSCKKHNTALRIGSNYGSLSKKILEKYGNTALGMVEAAQEFIDVCINNNYYNIVVSMKAGDTKIMIDASRLLQKKMIENKNIFPQHLGVTEAGNGLEARIKSSIGIGTLLSEGIGNTIRVSLTENPVNEISVANKIIEFFSSKKQDKVIRLDKITRKNTKLLNKYTIISNSDVQIDNNQLADFVFIKNIENYKPNNRNFICDYKIWQKKDNLFPVYTIDEYLNAKEKSPKFNFIDCTILQLDNSIIKKIESDETANIILDTDEYNDIFSLRNNYNKLIKKIIKTNVILKRDYNIINDDFIIKSSGELGSILIDKLADGLWITNKSVLPKQVLEITFGILQATKLRVTKTEFISCPTCGRTTFDIENITKHVKLKTSHLKGLKIAVMGCVVNGPGEMADADYGYVGASENKVHLYKGNKIIKRNIKQNQAVNLLIKLIKENGDWVDI